MNNNYAEKIAALLRKAEDPAATPQEAETYSRKAESLMVKWGVSEAVARQAAGESEPREKIIEKKVRIQGSYHQGEYALGSSIAHGLGNLRVLKSQGYGGAYTWIYIIGFESDVNRWYTLFASLRLQAASAMKSWVKHERATGAWDFDPGMTTGMKQRERFKAKRQFLTSFGYAVGSRLRDMHRETVETTTGAELAIRDRGTQVEEEVARMYPKLGKARGGFQWNPYGAAAGGNAGRNASLGGPTLPGQRKGIES